MFFTFPITIFANTPSTAKLKTILPLTRGIITRINVEFPAGHVGLTHIGINRGLNQVWPTNPDATLKSSNETIVWEEDYSLDLEPFQLEAYAWNEDDTYDHTITVRIELKSIPVQGSILDEIKALLGMTPTTAEG